MKKVLKKYAKKSFAVRPFAHRMDKRGPAELRRQLAEH